MQLLCKLVSMVTDYKQSPFRVIPHIHETQGPIRPHRLCWLSVTMETHRPAWELQTQNGRVIFNQDELQKLLYF